ncbi:MAG: ATP-binding cassette domain-containing protein, partial [Pseudomonadota bacterium]
STIMAATSGATLSGRPSIASSRTVKGTLRLVEAVLARLGLTDFAERPAPALSGGEQHRAHLARVLAQIEAGRRAEQGRYLFLDEPTASLDVAHQITVMRAAREITMQGTAAITVLHDLNLASAFADRIVLMDRGRIIADGAPHAVLTTARLEKLYATPFTVETGPANRPRVLPDYGHRSNRETRKETPADVHRHEPLPRSARSGGGF